MSTKKTTLHKSAIIGFSAIALSAFGASAQAAAVNLVKNGGFEQYTQITPRQYFGNNNSTVIGYGDGGVLDQFATVNDWSNPKNLPQINYPQPALNLLVLPQSGGNTPAPNVPGYAGWPLYGAFNGHNNGLTDSPDGGNYIASDSDPLYSGPLQQMINGLVVGHTYKLDFYEGAAQELGGELNIVTRWYVGFGDQTFESTLFSIPNAGFSGWKAQSTTFTANSTSALLRFVALGGPAGAPPISLLDGVSLVDTTPVPEPLTMLGAGAAIGLGGFFKRKLAKAKDKNQKS